MPDINNQQSCLGCKHARPDGTCGMKKDGHDSTRRGIEWVVSRIRHKLLVLSGKGGVGKSTVAVNLAAGLALRGLRVGLMDVDLHGPSIPGMLGLQGIVPAASRRWPPRWACHSSAGSPSSRRWWTGLWRARADLPAASQCH